MKGSKAYQFAHVDPKAIRIEFAYVHLSCGDKRMRARSEAGPEAVTEKQLGKFWAGMMALERRVHGAQRDGNAPPSMA
jgi:hypothetical protein